MLQTLEKNFWDTRLGTAIYERFHRSSPIRMNPNQGIVTAADAPMFVGLQLLYLSVTLSHDTRIVVFDLGLTEEQRDWCRSCDHLTLRDVDFSSLPFTQKHDHWQTWNKPFYLRESGFSWPLWLDSDLLVLGNLTELLANGSVFVKDYCPIPDLLINNPLLYAVMEAPELPHEPHVNGGVVSIDTEVDDDILYAWERCVRAAAENHVIRTLIAWHDQGALQWALRKTEKTHKIITDQRWNNLRPRRVYRTGEELLASIKHEQSYIVHFLGRPKPWEQWNEGRTHVASESLPSMTIFVLGHNRPLLDRVPQRDYIKSIRLDQLDVLFQNNQLAESRIYWWDGVFSDDSDYIGLISARWEEKFPYSIPIGSLDIIRDRLVPHRVLVGIKTTEHWLEHSEEEHPGMGNLLREAAKISDIKWRPRSVFWCNNFICHRNVYRDFVSWWREVFCYFYKKYGYDLPFGGDHDRTRHAAFFYERLTIIYFSSRDDLTFETIHTSLSGLKNPVFL